MTDQLEMTCFRISLVDEARLTLIFPGDYCRHKFDKSICLLIGLVYFELFLFYFNHIAFRQTKIANSFGLFECNKFKEKTLICHFKFKETILNCLMQTMLT